MGAPTGYEEVKNGSDEVIFHSDDAVAEDLQLPEEIEAIFHFDDEKATSTSDSTLQTNIALSADELKRIAANKRSARILEEITDKATQATYAATTITTALFAASKLAEGANDGISMGSDYIDGLCCIVNGVLLLLDESSAHQTQNKVLGSLSIVNGVTQALFAYQNFLPVAALCGSALASPVFALGILIDLSISAVNLHYAAKKTSFEGWLEETLLEIEHLDKKMAAETTSAGKNACKYKIECLTREVEARSKVYFHHAKADAKKAAEGTITKAIQKTLSTLSLKTREPLQAITNTRSYSTEPSPQERHFDQKKQEKLTKDFTKLKFLIAAKVLSVIGMTLIAIAGFTCPPALIAGLVFACAAVAYYVYQNKQSISNKSCFFQSAPKAPPSDSFVKDDQRPQKLTLAAG